jgi:hypothetical protein
MKQLLRISMIGLVLAACGSDGPSFGPPTAPTPQQQTAVTTTTQYLNLMADASGNSEAAASAAISFAITAPALFGSASASAPRPEIANVEAALAGLAAVTSRLDPSGCEVTTDHSVTWNHCTDNDITLDGSISWSPGHVDVDVHATGAAQGVTIDYSFSGTLTVSATAIDGDMTASYHVTAGAQSASETVHTQIGVTLAAGCVNGGTLTVTATGNGTGTRNVAIQVVWSGCNMFQVRNG